MTIQDISKALLKLVHDTNQAIVHHETVRNKKKFKQQTESD